jgi:membrane-associated phospholipid phosphatase
MKFVVPFVVMSSLAIPLRLTAQSTGSDQLPRNGSPTDASPQTPGSPLMSQPPPAFDRPVSWKVMIPNLISDQERIWSFPARLTHDQNWIPCAAVLGTTAALIALDPVEGSYFRRSSTFSGFNNIFSGNTTAIGTVVAPVSLYAFGLIRKDSKMQRTALLAGEAVADSEVLATVLKGATKRLRPADIAAGGNYSDSWFESSGSPLLAKGSFPSGHTIAAFSVATVVARRYGNHKWVPYAAYGMAALVGFSRLSLSAHFLSDVFVGSALGYSISRFAVLRQ